MVGERGELSERNGCLRHSGCSYSPSGQDCDTLPDGALNHDKARAGSGCFYLEDAYYSFLPMGKNRVLICTTVGKSRLCPLNAQCLSGNKKSLSEALTFLSLGRGSTPDIAWAIGDETARDKKYVSANIPLMYREGMWRGSGKLKPCVRHKETHFIPTQNSYSGNEFSLTSSFCWLVFLLCSSPLYIWRNNQISQCLKCYASPLRHMQGNCIWPQFQAYPVHVWIHVAAFYLILNFARVTMHDFK